MAPKPLVTKTRSEMSWAGAGLRALLIAAYFIVTTVWLPSAVLRASFVAGRSGLVTDLIALSVWGVFVAVGLWGLRRAQEQDWI